MFHLIDPDFQDSPCNIIDELRHLTEALASGYELSADVLATGAIRDGYRHLGSAIVRSLGDLSGELQRRGLTYFPEECAPHQSEAERRDRDLTLTMQGYFLGKQSAGFTTIARVHPNPDSPDPRRSDEEEARHMAMIADALAKAEAITSRMREFEDATLADGTPRLTMNDTDAVWLRAFREAVSEQEGATEDQPEVTPNKAAKRRSA
ncbi:hypothetical protein [Mesorhizobium sp. KR1-2]|uniref:hypothetical protein n=1 Tax=Mesorhizobium sp. KR1-2 TaxID=3156609 RepID=UPI0032B341FE